MKLFFLAAFFYSLNTYAIELKNINPNHLRISYEGTFQNRVMTNEKLDYDSQNHLYPSKERARLAWINAYLKTPGSLAFGATDKPTFINTWANALRAGVLNEETVNTTSFKAKEILFPNGRKITTTLEPVCIERTFEDQVPIDQLETLWTPVYKAASKAHLTPSVYHAGEASGAGHFHFGGTSRETNPIVTHLHLLPNLLAFFHNHASVLFGFSIPFDVGRYPFLTGENFPGFNSGTHHGRFQNQFISDIQSWHEHVGLALNNPKVLQGKDAFLDIFKGNLDYYYLNVPHRIHHYAAVNLSNTVNVFKPEHSKFTVEFRPIRPMPTAKHVQVMAEFIAHLLDYLANPKLVLVPRYVSSLEFQAMATPLFVESDWEAVKKEIGYSHPLLDELVYEYTRNPHLKVEKKGVWTYRESYSDRNRRGEMAEIYRAAQPTEIMPSHSDFEGHRVPLKEVYLGGQRYFVGVFDKGVKNNYWEYELREFGPKHIPETLTALKHLPLGHNPPPEIWEALSHLIPDLKGGSQVPSMIDGILQLDRTDSRVKPLLEQLLQELKVEREELEKIIASANERQQHYVTKCKVALEGVL